ncbi:MAG: hypothetical protein MZV63_05435 [Marinilabiliales bacterium]|nr:hypothetical protein [Marinilabiliales bacterium]
MTSLPMLTKSSSKSRSGKYYITANCPSIVEMIEKYHPGLVPNLAPHRFPDGCHCHGDT